MLQAQCLGAFLQIECSSRYMKNYSHSSFRFCSNMNSKERLFLSCLYNIVTTIIIQLLYFKNHKFYFSVSLVMFQVLSNKQSFSRVCAVTQSCPNLCDLMECSPPDSSPWGLLGKNTGMGCNFLLRGIFPIQQLEPTSPGAQAGRFFTPESPSGYYIVQNKYRIFLVLQRVPLGSFCFRSLTYFTVHTSCNYFYIKYLFISNYLFLLLSRSVLNS